MNKIAVQFFLLFWYCHLSFGLDRSILDILVKYQIVRKVFFWKKYM